MAESMDTKTLVRDTRAFLSDLAANNTRAWFTDNKARYDAQVKRPAELLVSQMTGWLERRDRQVRGKLFRPQRDVRFSEDKTPYHLHLHMLWSMPDGRCWFFGLAQDYATAGAGVMVFSPEQLDRYREAVAEEEGATLARLLDTTGWRLDTPDLKRVPAPHPTDHPQASLLRRKGLVAWDDGIAQTAASDPRAALEAAFERMEPLQSWLGTALGR